MSSGGVNLAQNVKRGVILQNLLILRVTQLLEETVNIKLCGFITIKCSLDFPERLQKLSDICARRGLCVIPGRWLRVIRRNPTELTQKPQNDRKRDLAVRGVILQNLLILRVTQLLEETVNIKLCGFITIKCSLDFPERLQKLSDICARRGLCVIPRRWLRVIRRNPTELTQKPQNNGQCDFAVR